MADAVVQRVVLLLLEAHLLLGYFCFRRGPRARRRDGRLGLRYSSSLVEAFFHVSFQI